MCLFLLAQRSDRLTASGLGSLAIARLGGQPSNPVPAQERPEQGTAESLEGKRGVEKKKKEIKSTETAEDTRC